MISLVRSFVPVLKDRRGVTAVEYAMIAGIIVAAILVGFTLLANNVSTQFTSIAGSV
jgi:pilus assembly protein Flp/PilA